MKCHTNQLPPHPNVIVAAYHRGFFLKNCRRPMQRIHNNNYNTVGNSGVYKLQEEGGGCHGQRKYNSVSNTSRVPIHEDVVQIAQATCTGGFCL